MLAGGTLAAGDYGKAIIDDKMPIASSGWSICDTLENPHLYVNENNPVLQKLSFTGRAQVDAAFFDSHGADYNSLHWRRFRSGFKAKVFDDFVIHAESDFDLNDRDPLYNGLTDTYIAWSRSDAFQLKIGKQSAGFTLDGATSSKNILRLERSLLSTNLWFPQEYFTGVAANGELGNWHYNVGIFSASTNPEFGDFQGGNFGLFSLGYDFTDAVALDTALVRFDYVNQQEHSNNNGTRDFAQILSLNGQFEQGPWGIWTDVAFGDGYRGQDDVFGLQLMPFYNVTDKLQLVASYNYLKGRGDNSVRFDRYESRIESGRADEMHEFFAGVNYYFCGHKLKWQNGVEYTTANDRANDGGDYDGWGFTSGIRMSW
ncbi:MAG: porin [Verrucomicrobiales bacterium]